MSGRSIRLIDIDELLATLEQDINVSVTGEENMEAVRRCLQEILDDVKGSPVVQEISESCNKDSVIALHDIFLHVGSITYGKERWFDQGDGTWYDRRHCDYVPLDEAVERLIETVREIEEDMEQDRWIPVTEMFPEDSPVLATNIFDFYIAGKIYPYENCQTGYCCESMLGGDLMTNVTAWMPLPEPYLLETTRNYSKEGAEHETD